MFHPAAHPNLSKTQPLVTASCHPWDKPISCPWIIALSHYPGCWPLCPPQWGPCGMVCPWHHSSLASIVPFCVLCLECSSETPLSPHSGLYSDVTFSGGALIRTLGSPPFSPHTHVLCISMTHLVCCLPSSTGVEAH